ncbi:4Fe-4S binding protein [Adlercreutzia aquisgranensis]|uniref:4Fe-4S binding protein n=1 Tax=Adlercreutzia aquisgranensis TaxID=2941323 RepID=UPI0020410EA1|nr:4Fe-4S binding protein [Adlercreutzia aquisgranensis]
MTDTQKNESAGAQTPATPDTNPPAAQAAPAPEAAANAAAEAAATAAAEPAAAHATAAVAEDAPTSEASAKKPAFTRRSVLAMAGCGVAGLVVGGVLASWGVTSQAIASGRIDLRTTPTKMIVTDRARCSGCQRCEMSCTLKNDGLTQQSISRVHVWENYNFGYGVGTGGGIFDDCQFTVQGCLQCADPQCAKYCPVHAIYADPETGARVVDDETCIGCGMCVAACPWNMPRINAQTGTSTKCISCGRCAEQCPNGAIKFIDWEDIAQKVLDGGVVSTATLVPGATLVEGLS